MPLKRNASLMKLSHDHRNTLMTAQLMKKGAPEYKGMPVTITDKLQYVHMHFVSEMLLHFEKEETILFPFILGRVKEIDEMVEELKNEHIEIQHQVNALPFVAEMDKAGRLIERHIRKEERELFEMIQKEFSEEELIILGEKLAG
jgi:iron-sulfur cluster repair protein YtfE (RIC family)